MPRQRASTGTWLPASLVISPSELKYYRRWQRQHCNLSKRAVGQLPTASEYAAFKAWLAKRDSGYFSDSPLSDFISSLGFGASRQKESGVASICGHRLPQAQKEVVERCPVCTVRMHLTYMKVLTRTLENGGGIVGQRWELPTNDNVPLQAWMTGKLDLLKEVRRLELIAQEEQQHQSDSQTEGIKTASEALELYWSSVENSSPDSSSASSRTSSESSPTHNASEAKNKPGIRFTDDTSFSRGRDPYYFWRKSPRYEAGKYTMAAREAEMQRIDRAIAAKSSAVAKVAGGHSELADDAHDADDEWEDVGADEDDDDEGVEYEAKDMEDMGFIVFTED